MQDGNIGLLFYLQLTFYALHPSSPHFIDVNIFLGINNKIYSTELVVKM